MSTKDKTPKPICDLDKIEIEIWKKRYLYTPSPCILTTLNLVKDFKNCDLRELCQNNINLLNDVEGIVVEGYA